MTSSSTHAPPAVVAARASIRKLHRRVTAFVGSILGLTAGLVVAGEAGAPEAVVWTIVGTIGLLTVGAIPFLGGAQSKGDEETVREWESRGRRAEFDRFERARGADAAEDPRMGVAGGGPGGWGGGGG